MSGSLNTVALTGIRSGFENLQKNASRIAGTNDPQREDAPSLVSAVVNLKANVQQVEASIAVLNVSGELIGTILDIKA